LEVFDSQTGATDRAVEVLLRLVQKRTPERSLKT
jgi:hypothetical protein